MIRLPAPSTTKLPVLPYIAWTHITVFAIKITSVKKRLFVLHYDYAMAKQE